MASGGDVQGLSEGHLSARRPVQIRSPRLKNRRQKRKNHLLLRFPKSKPFENKYGIVNDLVLICRTDASEITANTITLQFISRKNLSMLGRDLER